MGDPASQSKWATTEEITSCEPLASTHSRKHVHILQRHLHKPYTHRTQRMQRSSTQVWLCMPLDLYLYEHTVAVLRHTRRGHQIHRNTRGNKPLPLQDAFGHDYHSKGNITKTKFPICS